MAYDPNDPSYSRLARTGTAQGPGSIIERVMLISLNRMWTSQRKLYDVISKPKTLKAVKESTKLFESIGKVGQYAKELTKTFELTRSLISMPTRTATQGLDMLSAQMLAPISGAITQAIGQGMAAINQVIGPTLQQIGGAVGGFVRQQPIGAGIGGAIGGIAGAITGIPGLGLIGGLVGGGIEALIKAAAPETSDETEDENLRDFINNQLARGWSSQRIIDFLQNSAQEAGKALRRHGITTPDDLMAFMGLPPIEVGGAPALTFGDMANIDIGGAGGGIRGAGLGEGDLGGGGGGTAVIQILEDIRRSNQRIYRTQVWGGL